MASSRKNLDETKRASQKLRQFINIASMFLQQHQDMVDIFTARIDPAGTGVLDPLNYNDVVTDFGFSATGDGVAGNSANGQALAAFNLINGSQIKGAQLTSLNTMLAAFK